jgi:Arc/MetJ family transcription regulator
MTSRWRARFNPYAGGMSRTNIEIDDALIARVMRRYDFRTKREAVERALRRLDIEPLARGEILELEGTGWDGDLDQLRANREPVEDWIKRE